MNRVLPDLPQMPAAPAVEQLDQAPSLDLPEGPSDVVGEGAALPPVVLPGQMPPPPAPLPSAPAPVAAMPDPKPKPKSVAESIAPMEPRRPKAFHPGQIEVVALRAGQYDRDRRNEGDVFRVEHFSELGSWMQPTDPVIAAKHRQAMAAKRMKNRSEPKRRQNLLDDAD